MRLPIWRRNPVSGGDRKPRSTPRRSRRRISSLLILIVFVATVAGGAGWAVGEVLRPAEDPLEQISYSTVKVQAGEVGRSLTLNAVGSWSTSLIGLNQKSGVVTSISLQPGDEATQGSVLYTVDLRPVFIARGDTPAFRSIGLGTKGADAAQVQVFLSELGYYAGRVDGDVGGMTVEAIKAFQWDAEVEVTGEFALGDIIFVPNLPGRFSVDTEHLAKGKMLSGGEPVLLGLSGTPNFSLPLTAGQGVC